MSIENTLVCPQCHGAKAVRYFDSAPGSSVTVECPTCAGEGMVDEAEAFVYEQEQKALCDCGDSDPRIVVIEGQKRCGVCGRLLPERNA